MLQHETIGKSGKHPAVDPRRLFDDGEKRYGQHDALQAVASGVLQGKAQHGERFPGTSRCGQRENAGGELRSQDCRLPEGIASLFTFDNLLPAVASQVGHVSIQRGPCERGIKLGTGGTVLLALRVALEMRFGVEKIRVNKAGTGRNVHPASPKRAVPCRCCAEGRLPRASKIRPSARARDVQACPGPGRTIPVRR